MPKITVGGGASNGLEPGYEADRPEPEPVEVAAPEPQPEPGPQPDEAGEPAPDVED